MATKTGQPQFVINRPPDAKPEWLEDLIARARRFEAQKRGVREFAKDAVERKENRKNENEN